MQILYKTLGLTSKQTESLPIRSVRWLMLIRKLTGIYCKTHMEINELFGILHAHLNVKACGILRSECDGTRWRTGGEVKGKMTNGVGSQYSHTTSQRGVSSITNADARTSAASSRLNWLPRRFKWTRPFRRKTKCGFCACAIRFRTSSTYRNNSGFKR